MNFVLKYFLSSGRFDALVDGVVTFLASTVKNKDSMAAARLLQGVSSLRDACDNFINEVAGR